MTYDHAVKYKGVIYPTGAEVPVEEIKSEQPVTDDKEEKSEQPVTDDKIKDGKKK